MCGIVGYIGNREATSVLISGLRRLEYRGYDSAGIAVYNNDRLDVIKCKGRLAALETKLKEVDIKCKLGIGHTRWATHGEPNDINSHPHISYNERIAVVHNGIIENYLKIKEFLENKGVKFLSDTDTEVIAHLVDYHYKGNLVKAVIETLNELEGSYALCVICSDTPEEFVAAKKDSPMIVRLGEKENFYRITDIPDS